MSRLKHIYCKHCRQQRCYSVPDRCVCGNELPDPVQELENKIEQFYSDQYDSDEENGGYMNRLMFECDLAVKRADKAEQEVERLRAILLSFTGEDYDQTTSPPRQPTG